MIRGAFDPAMLAAAETLAHFFERRDEALLDGLFGNEVTILENFPPYLFAGADAVANWRRRLLEHLASLSELRHRFGDPQDFRRTGDRVFFTLPTTWSGHDAGAPFTEEGGWSFLLVREAHAWRIAAYCWAVTAVQS